MWYLQKKRKIPHLDFANGALLQGYEKDNYLLCSSVLVPQMTGGDGFPGLETEKRSFWHWVWAVTSLPPAATSIPLSSVA